MDVDFEVVEEASVGCWVWDRIASEHMRMAGQGRAKHKFFLCESFGYDIK